MCTSDSWRASILPATSQRFLARSLQSLLGTWNPSRRRRDDKDKDLNIGKKLPPGTSWIHFAQWELSRPPRVSDILKAYFGGFSFPHNAADILFRGINQVWKRPKTNKELPRCCKIVLYRDVAQASPQQCVADCLSTLCNCDLTPDEITLELGLLRDFFKKRVFADTRGGAQGSWWQQQLKYLKHFRQRPVLHRDGARSAKVTPGTVENVAGGNQFQKAASLQSDNVVVNGCSPKSVCGLFSNK